QVRRLQLEFRIQVQEWKNILLRSGDPRLAKKHRAQFFARAARVTEILGVLAQVEDEGGQVLVKELRRHHLQLMNEYRAGLSLLDRTGPSGRLQADAKVRGIDRDFRGYVDRLIRHDREATTALHRAHVQSARWLLIAFILCFILLEVLGFMAA